MGDALPILSTHLIFYQVPVIPINYRSMNEKTCCYLLPLATEEMTDSCYSDFVADLSLRN